MKPSAKKLILLCAASVTLFSACRKDEYADCFQNLPFEMKALKAPVFPSRTLTVKAENFGLTSIQQAIDSLSSMGGGTVVIPAGSWTSGPIELKSDICLHTEKGAIIQFTNDYDAYPLIRTYYEGKDSWRVMSPITAHDAENIAVTGEGIFDGNGDWWRPVRKNNVSSWIWRDFLRMGGCLNEKEDTWFPTPRALEGDGRPYDKTDYEDCLSVKEYLRPVMVNLLRCDNILLKGITFRNSPAWCLHPALCSHLIIDGVSMMNESWAANGDALDLESCSDVLVKDCLLDAGDDAICLKSGKDEEGRRRGVATERVVIEGCTVFKGHGGFVIGSEMSGGVRDVRISNCTFVSTDNGLRFKSCRGRGGEVKNIWAENINMSNIKSNAILFDLYYFTKGVREIKPVDEGTPTFHHIYLDGINCASSGSVGIMQGLPEMLLHDIEVKNSVIRGNKPLEAIDTCDIRFRNVAFISPDTTVIY